MRRCELKSLTSMNWNSVEMMHADAIWCLKRSPLLETLHMKKCAFANWVLRELTGSYRGDNRYGSDSDGSDWEDEDDDDDDDDDEEDEKSGDDSAAGQNDHGEDSGDTRPLLPHLREAEFVGVSPKRLIKFLRYRNGSASSPHSNFASGWTPQPVRGALLLRDITEITPDERYLINVSFNRMSTLF